MRTLGKPAGDFILHDSDYHIGSFFSTQDLLKFRK